MRHVTPVTLVLFSVLAACARDTHTVTAAPAKVQRRLLETRPVEGSPGEETQLWLVEYPPGAEAPRHRHPALGVGYVLEGAFESAFGSEQPITVRAGQSFIESPHVEHRLFRNASTQSPLKFVMSFTFPKGTPVLELLGRPEVQLKREDSALELDRPALYPETLELNPLTQQFLVGSVREGAVYQVAADGRTSKLVDDPRLVSVLGIAADGRNKRLWVTSSDLDASVKHAPEGPKHHAAVGVYDLTNGSALRWVDLSALVPHSDHLMNGITLDLEGNAYVTDSFAAAIYKIDPEGHSSVLLQNEVFRGAGINLNGIVHHPDGFLLAIMKSSGRLYRVPLADPSKFSAVDTPSAFVGGDGLWLAGPERLLVIANKTPAASANAAFVLHTDNAWQDAKLDSSMELGDVYPTTCAAQNGKLYLLSSKLDGWLTADASKRAALAADGPHAELRQIGMLQP